MKILTEIAAGGSCNLGQCKNIVELNAINKMSLIARGLTLD